MNTSVKKTRKNFAFIAKQLMLICLNVSVMIITITTVVFMYAYIKTPVATGLESRNIPQTTIIYDRMGQHELYRIHGEEDRKVITHDQIPDTMRIATIAAEDDSFYRHKGIDPPSIIRALRTDIKNKNVNQGASTITQQLARNAFLTREKTIRRKLLEMVIAIKIERNYSKDEILDMYLNEIPYGSNAYGIETASETYFGKKAKDLTLEEAAFISALPKATSYYSPYGENKDELIRRQRGILDRIAELKLAEANAVDEAKKVNILSKVIPKKDNIDSPHFVFYVKEELEKQFGKQRVEEGGFRVYTTLDYDKQKLAEGILREAANTTLKQYGATNAALVSLNPKNGQILAMAGSIDYFNDTIDGQVNVATRPRQPGSSFKPFVYAAAFEKGFQPESPILDAPISFPLDRNRNYTPRNYDGNFHGALTMRQALAMSLNVPAVKTLSMIGVPYAIDMAHRLGITTLNETNRYGLSLVLGGGEVKLLDETVGYSVFANDGKKNSPKSILKVVDNEGKVYYEPTVENSPVLDPQIARKINSILSDNAARTPIFGPNNKLVIAGKTVAAKTGTTQEWRDAWTVGYTPEIATGVWAGNNDNRRMRTGADGSFVAAPIWNKFMSQVLKNQQTEPFIAYENMPDKKQPLNNIKTKTTYYRKKDGKKISEKKAKSMDPKKVEVRVEYILPKNKDGSA